MPPRAPTRLEILRLGLIDYPRGLELQRQLGAACHSDGIGRLLLLEHPPTYTFGARGRTEHLLVAQHRLAGLGASVYHSNRGGDVTFHGPGQLVGYPIIDLKRWGKGPVWYVRALEETILLALAEFGIAGERRNGFPGVWVGNQKVAAIGVHVSRGITSHGFGLNVDPDQSYFSHIVPCGLKDAGITSMAALLGTGPSMDHAIEEVSRAFVDVFGVALEDTRIPAGVA